jgi:hypothetical protein
MTWKFLEHSDVVVITPFSIASETLIGSLAFPLAGLRICPRNLLRAGTFGWLHRNLTARE